MKCFTTFLLVFCLGHLYAQTVLINGKKTNQQISWEDFRGDPDSRSPFDAMTYWNVNYKYNIKMSHDSARREFIVAVNIISSSWVKESRKTDYLLNHEQGHFIIAELCGKEIANALSNLPFTTEGYQENLHAVFQQKLSQYKEMERKYDEETNHSREKEKQQQWDQLLRDQLNTFDYKKATRNS